MSSIPANSSLRTVAEIIYAAVALGHDAWNGGGARERDPAAGAGDSAPPDFSLELRRLFSLLRDRGVPHVLVGGVALLTYIEGRNTQDIDLILSAQSLDHLPEIAVSERTTDFARGTIGALRVDLLLTSNPVFELVQHRYTRPHSFREIEVTCATVAGLVLLKLYALPSLYRQVDGQRIALYEADLMMLIERYRPDVAALLDELRPYVDAYALQELRNIVAEIEQRIQRVRRKQKS